MKREQLLREIRRLRAGIRNHRDCTGHELCWHQPDLWNLLPEKIQPHPTIPDWPRFLRGCVRYRHRSMSKFPELLAVPTNSKVSHYERKIRCRFSAPRFGLLRILRVCSACLDISQPTNPCRLANSKTRSEASRSSAGLPAQFPGSIAATARKKRQAKNEFGLSVAPPINSESVTPRPR